ncbi:MAG: cupin domain-containing protein [Alphaproteobacteria bacterium]|nr:cupin domain-containing protein [Alphaproteobacteria bacterium]
MMPRFHAQDEHLMDYAAGSLAEPIAVLVATHLALCPACRARVEAFEAVGGALLEKLGTEAIDRSLRDSVLAKLDETDSECAPPPSVRKPAPIDLRVPEPLRGYLGGGLDTLAWKARGPVDEVRILREHAGVTSRLLRIKAGTPMPHHTHDGNELTLVLTGGFTDRGDHFLRGDVAAADSSVDHCPAADPGEDCYCFAVNDAPLRLTGPIGRLLNPFLRI